MHPIASRQAKIETKGRKCIIRIHGESETDEVQSESATMNIENATYTDGRYASTATWAVAPTIRAGKKRNHVSSSSSTILLPYSLLVLLFPTFARIWLTRLPSTALVGFVLMHATNRKRWIISTNIWIQWNDDKNVGKKTTALQYEHTNANKQKKV